MKARMRRAAVTGAAGALVVAGTLAGTGTAPASGPSTLGYTCQFPAGPRPVPVSISATIPGEVAAAEPIQPADVSISLSLQRDEVGTGPVAGTVRLAVSVTHGGAAAAADWKGLTIPPAPVPDDGDVVVTASGPVGAVTVGTSGPVSFAAGDLELSIVDSESVTCKPDAETTFGTVTVSEKPEPPGSSAPGSAPSSPKIEVAPAPGAPPVAAADIPPECGNIPVPPRGRVGCTFVTGYTSVRKLNGSIRVEPGLTNVGIARPVLQLPFLRADNPAELVGGRFPPMKGTFLTFGFVPISASMELSQVGPMNIHTDGLAVAPFTYSVTATSQLSARIYDVKVNGVPLDVGPNCRTATPINATLTGGTPQYTDILKGGPLSGTVEIPPFSGCGVTENLDPLLTGTVSGPDNQVRVVQGTLCVPADPRSPCPPLIPQVPPPSS